MVELSHTLRHFKNSIGNGWLRLRQTGLDLLLPPVCTFCHVDLQDDHESVGLCHNCRSEICNLDESVCLYCGNPTSDASVKEGSGCPYCLGNPFLFRCIIALAAYNGKARTAVLQSKYLDGQPLTMALARCLLAARQNEIDAFLPDLIVPIPMHWTRRLKRGTNGPETVAHCLAGKLKIPFQDVHWSSDVKPQGKVSYHKTQGNEICAMPLASQKNGWCIKNEFSWWMMY